jgi:hypothetical protein
MDKKKGQPNGCKQTYKQGIPKEKGGKEEVKRKG